MGKADNLARFQWCIMGMLQSNPISKKWQMDSHLHFEVVAYKIDDTKICDRSTRMYGSESKWDSKFCKEKKKKEIWCMGRSFTAVNHTLTLKYVWKYFALSWLFRQTKIFAIQLFSVKFSLTALLNLTFLAKLRNGNYLLSDLAWFIIESSQNQ